MTYGIHKYWVMNDGTVIHDDFMAENVVESDESTWPNKSYMVNADLLPSHLLHTDDDVIGIPILQYHKDEIDCPLWLESKPKDFLFDLFKELGSKCAYRYINGLSMRDLVVCKELIGLTPMSPASLGFQEGWVNAH